MPPRGSEHYDEIMERREPNALPMALLALAAVGLVLAILLQAIELRGYRYGDAGLDESATRYESRAFGGLRKRAEAELATLETNIDACATLLKEVQASGFKPVGEGERPGEGPEAGAPAAGEAGAGTPAPGTPGAPPAGAVPPAGSGS